MSGLPSGWVLLQLKDIQKEGGGSVDPRLFSQEEFDLFSIPSFSNQTPEAVIGADIGSSKQVVSEDDILLSKIVPHIRRVWVVPKASDLRQIASSEWIVYRSSHVEPHFIRLALSEASFRAKFLGTVSGVGGSLMRANPKKVAEFYIALPPLAEQKRIVAKLDALSAKSTRARTELSRIEALISRYKQAVLSKAFSGHLVDPIPYDPTLTETVIARQREAILAGQKTRNTKGTVSGPDRRPVEIGELPSSWCVLRLEDLTDPLRLIQYGILMPGPDTEGGIPYVKVMNIKGGSVELSKIRRTTTDIHQSYARSTLKKGDLLLTIRGTVGRTAETPSELDGGNITQDTVRIAVLSSVSSRYILWYLQSPAVQDYFDWNKKGVAVQGINVGDVRPMEVPVAPPEEQNEIVRRIESAFAKIDKLAIEAKRALELLGKLDDAILAKAFRGDLVPQDEADEPAEKILERIRAEREAAPKVKSKRIKRVTNMPTARNFLNAKLENWPAGGVSFQDLKREFGGSYDDLKEAVFASLADEQSPLQQIFDDKTSTMAIRKREG